MSNNLSDWSEALRRSESYGDEIHSRHMTEFYPRWTPIRDEYDRINKPYYQAAANLLNSIIDEEEAKLSAMTMAADEYEEIMAAQEVIQELP